jgi:glycosyltransferase involved in cell wall biosynthesis
VAQVSVILIHKAIKSLQAQTFSDLDIFVVDDGSTDGTFEVLQSMAEADPGSGCSGHWRIWGPTTQELSR